MHTMEPVKNQVSQTTSKIFNLLQKDYVIIGKTRVKSWHGWLVMGILVGIAMGVVFIANRSLKFEDTYAADISLSTALITLSTSSPPLAHQINLSWTVNNGNISVPDPSQAGFVIQRHLANQVFTNLASTTLTTFSYSDKVSDGTKYYYHVRAFKIRLDNSIQWSPFSNIVQVVTPIAPPLVLSAIIESSTVRLNWIDDSNVEDGFKIERRLGTEVWTQIAQVASNIEVFLDTTIVPTQKYQYRYRVKAYRGTQLSLTSPVAAASDSRGTACVSDSDNTSVDPNASYLVSGRVNFSDGSSIADRCIMDNGLQTSNLLEMACVNSTLSFRMYTCLKGCISARCLP